ncbi:MAG TPA: endonuclease/exonuclease/phosphatase family protein [Kofleriaceae bacterium]|nr:endonuclease/exonuclease/phosphatase family protein [Kofleriaceae bacterium]
MRRGTFLRLTAIAAIAGCGDDLREPRADPGTITAMTYNVFRQGDGERGQNIADHIASRAPDFAALQEVAEPEALLERLPARYALTQDPVAGIALLHDDAWLIEDQGSLELGEDDDGWGARAVVWARFSAPGEGPIYFHSTHWCAPTRSNGDRCDESRQLEYAERMIELAAEHASSGPVVIAGDLNVWDGFEDGMPVRHFIDSGLVDVYRTLHPDGPGTTFVGEPPGPGGRLDYIFSTSPVDVLDAAVDTDAVPPGQGSDHYAVLARLAYAP